MKRRVFITIAILLMSAAMASAQIKIVGDDYSNNLTASKSYYEKDVDFDKYFPVMDYDNICWIHSTLITSKGGYSAYLFRNLSGDTVYLSKSHDINDYEEVMTEQGTKSHISFCVNRDGQLADSTIMPIGYYEIEGYVFCKDNEDAIRSSYGLPIIKYEYYRHEGSYSIKELKNAIIRYDSNFVATEYIRYIIFRSLSTNNKYYISLIDGLKNLCDYSDYDNITDIIPVFQNMMPLRFYYAAKSFIDKEVKFMKKVNLIKDGISGDLLKPIDDFFVVRDIVMKDNKYYVILEGAKTGSFALKIYNIWGIKDKTGEEVGMYDWRYYDLIAGLPDGLLMCMQNNDIHPIVGETSDIHGVLVDNEEADFFIIKKEDIALLNKREKKQKTQLKREQKVKEQQQKQAEAAFRQQMITKHGARFGEMVANKRVAIDMTKDMCHDAWGTPMNTYRTTTKYGQSEVWCYNYKTRIYFYNGKVVQIED